MPSHHKKTAVPDKREQKLRIIAGRWRGRLLPFPSINGLRPTGNRVRETLFNWLMPTLPGSHCLDLFAGSGALGFEALSRGAAGCTMVELNAAASKQLRANSADLQCDSARVIECSALDYLQRFPAQAYDVVFIDPPFAQDLWPQVIHHLQEKGWLQENALIYLEMPNDKSLAVPANWQLHRQKRAGKVCYCLYRYETNPEGTG